MNEPTQKLFDEQDLKRLVQSFGKPIDPSFTKSILARVLEMTPEVEEPRKEPPPASPQKPRGRQID